MRTIKLIAGAACSTVALFFILCSILALFSGLFNDASVLFIPAALFGAVGWLLISRRNVRMSWTSKAVITGFMVLLAWFVLVGLIPGLVAVQYVGSQNVCVNNLRQLDAAKNEWALETGAPNGALVPADDLTPYIQLDSKGHLPTCPQGGTYIIGRVGEEVRCSLGTSDWPYEHTLSDTNRFDGWTNFKESYATLFGFHNPRKP